jgi:hypothetical protein
LCSFIVSSPMIILIVLIIMHIYVRNRAGFRLVGALGQSIWWGPL